MPHVITQSCCNDAACVTACPVDCIHPRPDEAGFDTAEMLYIDPDVCIDCGACVSTCPVDAIRTTDDLGEQLARYGDLNALLAAGSSTTPRRATEAPLAPTRPLRVAIVGAGPAGLYAAERLLTLPRGKVEVDVFDRLPTPWGLIRAGVAPDHPATKGAADQFRYTARRPGFRYHLNVEVGRDISPEELAEHFHAVIYAFGAMHDRRLGIPGEDLPGSCAATEFVAWYNGHPDFADRTFDLSGERAVVIGNGNVALDVARILASDPEQLARTDIADHALDALRASKVREIVVIGRRGPAQAAYTLPELEALRRLPDVDVVAEDIDVQDRSDVDLQGPHARLKVEIAAEYARTAPFPGTRRIVLRYLRSPVEIIGDDRVEGIRLVRNELQRNESGLAAVPTADVETLATQLVLRSIGYRGAALSSVPFDEKAATIPNDRGRVTDESGNTLVGSYTTGWIKRGPSGAIGTNKSCAEETVACLLEDERAGSLREPPLDRAALERLLSSRRPDRVSHTGWEAIDRHERTAGATSARPRVKVVSTPALLDVAAGVEA